LDTEAGFRSVFELILEGIDNPTRAQIAARVVAMRKRIRAEKRVRPVDGSK
jgi:hypothetical protein